jgi:RNA polymerase sigma factor (sigma-70 family)
MREGAEAQAVDARRSDAQLVNAIAAGDWEAEREFVERYMPSVRAILLARSRNRDLTADLVQDVMLAALCALRRNQLRDANKLANFVLLIARNQLSQYYRASIRTPVQLDEPDEIPDLRKPVDGVETQKRKALLLKAIQRLDTTDRIILQKTLVDGLKPGIIAQQLSMRPDLVRQRKLRATREVINYFRQLSQTESQATILLGVDL